MVDGAVDRCLMNMRYSTLIEGILHRNIPEYPEEAVREAFDIYPHSLTIQSQARRSIQPHCAVPS